MRTRRRRRVHFKVHVLNLVSLLPQLYAGRAIDFCRARKNKDDTNRRYYFFCTTILFHRFVSLTGTLAARARAPWKIRDIINPAA